MSMRWVFVVALGYILLNVTYQCVQGPDRVLDAGHDYVVGDLPGHLYYWPPGKSHSMIGLFDEKIEGFLIVDTWIVGKTKNDWFAVEKKGHQIYYPLPSEKEVKKITGLDFSSSELMTRFPKLSVWRPSPHEYTFEITRRYVGYVGLGYVLMVLLITIVRCTHRRRNKLHIDTSQEEIIEHY